MDGDGLTHAHVDELTAGIEPHVSDYLVVGDEDADPAVAQVVSIGADGVILVRVLPAQGGTWYQPEELEAALTVAGGGEPGIRDMALEMRPSPR